MIIDRNLRFSNGQDLSQVIGTYASTDVIDLHGAGLLPTLASGQGARDMGIGDRPSLKLLVQVLEAFAAAGAATLQVHFQGAEDDGAGAPGAWVTWWSSPLYALADLVVGARLLDIDFPRPPAGEPYPRFVRLLYQIATDTTTAGTIFAAVVIDRMDQPIIQDGYMSGYPAGITVPN